MAHDVDKALQDALTENLPDDAFQFVQLDEKIYDQKFETEPIGFFKDAMIRFVRNKASIVAFILISLVIISGIVGPMVSGYTYREQNIPAANLPPRIPGLEKLGIFNGTKTLRVQKERLETLYKDSYLSTIREYTNEVRYGDGTYTTVEMVEIKLDAYILQNSKDLYYWFGTDALGRDIFTRTFYGVRISLIISSLSTIICLVIGVIYGCIAGYYGGKVDMIMMRITEIFGGIPDIVILTLCIIYMGKTSMVTIIVGYCLTGWIGSARITRVQFYRYKNREYVLAAQTLGAKDGRLIIKHILPNAVGTLITSFALIIPGRILGEAGLAYLGLGLQAPTPSLGVMCQDGQLNLTSYPYKIVAPALLISTLMICFNLFGNGLRDAFNPSLRGT